MKPDHIELILECKMWVVRRSGLLYFEEEDRKRALDFASDLASQNNVDLVIIEGRSEHRYEVVASRDSGFTLKRLVDGV